MPESASRGVSAPGGGVCSRGVSAPGPGGVCSEGCLLRGMYGGVCSRGVSAPEVSAPGGVWYPSMH